MIDTLHLWLPIYVKEMEYQMGRQVGDLPEPRAYVTKRSFTKFFEDQLPTIIVVSTGLDKDPLKEGDGNYRGIWRLHAGIVVATSDMSETNKVAKMYGAAIRGVVTQHGSLGGIASGMTWYDEGYDDLPDDDTTRFLGAATLSFRVEVDEIVNWQRGPDTTYLPDPGATTPPGAVWPEADTVTVEIEKEAL